LRSGLRGRPFQEIHRAFDRLGSSWVPENDADLKELDEILSHAET
jgi:hypothetical protein